MSEKFSPEDKAKMTESRTLRDAELLERGAHYRPDGEREPVLTPNARQVKTIKNEDPSTREAGERKEKTEVLRTFEIPDQVGELDFKAFLEKSLFGAYYLAHFHKEEPFYKMVYEPSQPFSGIKGRTFAEIKVAENTGEKAVLTERDIKPVSLNEWRYLLTKLTDKQLRGNTYYRVQFDDGSVHTIEIEFDRSGGGGPYGLNLRIHKLSPQGTRRGFNHEDVYPMFIAPIE
jgi:hypothetical protein